MPWMVWGYLQGMEVIVPTSEGHQLSFHPAPSSSASWNSPPRLTPGPTAMPAPSACPNSTSSPLHDSAMHGGGWGSAGGRGQGFVTHSHSTRDLTGCKQHGTPSISTLFTTAGQGGAQQGTAQWCRAGQGMAQHSTPGQSRAHQGMAQQAWARQGAAQQGRAGQGRAE